MLVVDLIRRRECNVGEAAPARSIRVRYATRPIWDAIATVRTFALKRMTGLIFLGKGVPAP
jgi:hypothetical protein